MSWQPVSSGLEQIIQLLKESQSPDTEIQRQVQQVGIKGFSLKNTIWYWVITDMINLFCLYYKTCRN